MKRALLIGAVVVVAALPGAAVGEAVPVLAGPWGRDQEGYGHAKPSAVYNGGDGTGLVKQIRWLTWGRAKAIGEGTGLYVGPDQHTFEGRTSQSGSWLSSSATVTASAPMRRLSGISRGTASALAQLTTSKPARAIITARDEPAGAQCGASKFE